MGEDSRGALPPYTTARQAVKRYEQFVPRDSQCPTPVGRVVSVSDRRLSMNADEMPFSRLRMLRVRDESVLLDGDLAELYGVQTKAFNQAIRRNAHRFPRDFAFQLTGKEWVSLRSQIVTLDVGRRGRHRKYRPWAFTEHGAIMAATLLNSDRAVAMSTYVVRAFVRLRRELLSHATLEARLGKIEQELFAHDTALQTLFSKIKPLLVPSSKLSGKEMGFHTVQKKPQ